MSKKYKNKKCVYCAESISVTGDHVFAREFFLADQRDNLPQVPACAKCNGKKSELEHYLTSVLPFGGMHAQAKKNLETMVPKRLIKNNKLYSTLRSGMTYVENNGTRNMALPVKGEHVAELFAYIAKGLSWFHWNAIIDKTSFVYATSLTKTGERFFQEYYFALHANQRIENTIGDDAFSYIGVQGVDTDQITIWKFKIYAGITMTDGNTLNNCSNSIGVLTGPLSMKSIVVSIFDNPKTN